MAKQEEENSATNFINELSNSLEENRFTDAVNLVQDSNHENIIMKASWDIVPVVFSYLTAENKQDNENVTKCCQTILNTIAEKCNPSEVVLELLEQVESSETDVKIFCVILTALSISIKKMTDKTKAIEWCVSTIKSYVDGLPVTEKQRSEIIDNNFMSDNIMVITGIKTVYTEIILFLEPLVEEAALQNENSEKYIILRDYLLSVLMFLLGKPLCCLQEELKSDSGEYLTEKFIVLMTRINGDLLWFLNIVNKRMMKSILKKPRNNYEKNYNVKTTLFEGEENIPDLAYANLYFNVLTKRHLWLKMPQIYLPRYIFQGCICLVYSMLQEQENIIISKGLSFMEELLNRLGSSSLTSELLEFNIYFDLFKKITKIMIYCDSNNERKKAVKIFQDYIEAFTMEAKYLILLQLYKISEHSGLISLITGILKKSIIQCLGTSPPTKYFLGMNLESLLKQVCKLPHGSASDLVEISDEVISSLNLLRFLFIRDKHNETGIWNMADELKNDYLKPLREGVNLCRAHWKVKIKDLEEQKKVNIENYDNSELEKNDTEVTLIVGGEKLPPMPVAEKIAFCYQAVNGLDVIESIIIRVNECIVDNPFKKQSDIIYYYKQSAYLPDEPINDQGFRSLWTSRVLLTDQPGNISPIEDNQEHGNRESDEEYEQNIKAKILTESLKFVNEWGWSQQAISAGAESIGYPGVIHGMFPRHGADLVQHFYVTCNNELKEILEKQAFSTEKSSIKEKKTLEKHVRNAVEIRLRMIIPYKKTWPQALAIMTLPTNVPMSLANLLTLIDDICYYSGDRSVDINWYTRRVVLTGIYKVTELYMLQDNSEDHTQTWQFLERRINDAAQVHTVLTTTTNLTASDQTRVIELARATFSTARNILGLNWNR